MAAGASVTFVTAAITDSLVELVTAAGVRLARIEPPGAPTDPDREWDGASWPEAVQRLDAALTAEHLADLRCDWLVVDHYGLDRCWETAMRRRTGRLAVIDDLANRSHDCELLLDQTYGREDAEYRPYTGGAAELLLGARYALLREEFAKARPAALARHLEARSVGRVLISLGMTDVGAFTEAAACAALAATDAQIDIVLGSAAPTLTAIRALAETESRIALHIDSDRVCALMAEADLAIGAAGTTSWERCCLGLPAITFITAGNQRVIAAKLAAAGAIHFLDAPDVDAIAAALIELGADAQRRIGLALASAQICDGEGALRVASRLLPRRRTEWTV